MCKLAVKSKILMKKFQATMRDKMHKKDKAFSAFLNEKLPVFWIIGASKCGKSTVGHFLSDCSNYRLINLAHLIQTKSKNGEEERDEGKFVSLFKDEIINTFKYCHGYIFDDFPNSMKQSAKFAKYICKPNLVIYISLSMDALLSRVLSISPTTDLNKARVEYVKSVRFAEKLYRKYEGTNNAIKMYSQLPMADTHTKLLEFLENEFGYKFHQVVKN